MRTLLAAFSLAALIAAAPASARDLCVHPQYDDCAPLHTGSIDAPVTIGTDHPEGAGSVSEEIPTFNIGFVAFEFADAFQEALEQQDDAEEPVEDDSDHQDDDDVDVYTPSR